MYYQTYYKIHRHFKPSHNTQYLSNFKTKTIFWGGIITIYHYNSQKNHGSLLPWRGRYWWQAPASLITLVTKYLLCPAGVGPSQGSRAAVIRDNQHLAEPPSPGAKGIIVIAKRHQDEHRFGLEIKKKSCFTNRKADDVSLETPPVFHSACLSLYVYQFIQHMYAEFTYSLLLTHFSPFSNLIQIFGLLSHIHIFNNLI